MADFGQQPFHPHGKEDPVTMLSGLTLVGALVVISILTFIGAKTQERHAHASFDHLSRHRMRDR